MKVYKITVGGESDVVSANTIIEALQVYCDVNGMWINEFDLRDDICEIPESEWDKIVIRNSDYDEMNNNWQKKNLIDIMKNVSSPDIIGGTSYLDF